MREIEFRGKSVLGGCWEYGYYTKEGGYSVIRRNEVFELNKEATPIIVAERTVGQWTGLVDRKNKKIHEGDIINFYHSEGKEMSVFGAVVLWKSEWCGFYFAGNLRLNSRMRIEVIGNIHDNPELISA